MHLIVQGHSLVLVNLKMMQSSSISPLGDLPALLAWCIAKRPLLLPQLPVKHLLWQQNKNYIKMVAIKMLFALRSLSISWTVVNKVTHWELGTINYFFTGLFFLREITFLSEVVVFHQISFDFFSPSLMD
jgi:hypothetical protein